MLDQRAKLLLKALVERYIADGQPVGSRTISRAPGLNLSPASIRNVMQDLEELGLLAAPHTSAGRLPTEQGLGVIEIRQQGTGQGHGHYVPQAAFGQSRSEFDLVGKQGAGDGKQQVALGGHGARSVGQEGSMIGSDPHQRLGAAAD